MNAHENEYLAAISGMADHTMPPAQQQPAPGDFVSGMTAGVVVRPSRVD